MAICEGEALHGANVPVNKFSLVEPNRTPVVPRLWQED
jgi:hypothetical protein